MFPSLYAILDAGLVGERAVEVADEFAGVGVELMQYRDKMASARRFFEICGRLSARLRGRARFIVNDRADIAALCDAGGVHVGQEDLRAEDARAICGSGRWVGVSTHNLKAVSRGAGDIGGLHCRRSRVCDEHQEKSGPGGWSGIRRAHAGHD